MGVVLQSRPWAHYSLQLERSPCCRLLWPILVKADFSKEGSKLPHLINGHVLPTFFRMSLGVYPGMICMCLHLPMNSWKPLETLGQNSLEKVSAPSRVVRARLLNNASDSPRI